MKQLLLEVCVDSFESAKNAIDGGADRLEICTALELGGLTPSIGLVQQITDISKIPLHILIRPRSGNFTYSNSEFDTILQNIDFYKTVDIQGIVCGVLLKNGDIDLDRTKILVERSKPLSFTFHRAFDHVTDISKALENLIDLNIDRILTSGKHQTAIQGIENIIKLVKQAANRIIIMPGSGISPDNIKQLIRTGAKEFHMSGKTIKICQAYKNELLTGTNEGNYSHTYITNLKNIKNTVEILQNEKI
jgi:copper homeostasis protein